MQNSSNFIRSLQILFFSMLAGQIMVFAILWFFVVPPVQPGTHQEPFDWLLIAVWAGLQVFSFFMGRKLIESARAETNFSEKCATYRKAQVMRSAPIEGSVLICLIGYFFVTANYVLLALAAMGIGIFATLWPSRNRAVRELDLTTTEEMLLDEA